MHYFSQNYAHLRLDFYAATQTAKKAHKENISLKEACVSLGFLSAEEFDKVFKPEQMVWLWNFVIIRVVPLKLKQKN